ncbi:MAG: ComEA family DNA-binding protein [Myxococcales bacterium]
MRALVTAALLAGMWGAGAAAGRRGLPPLPPRCAVRVEVRGPEHRSVLCCAGGLGAALQQTGLDRPAPAGLRDGDRLTASTPAGELALGRMAGPALRLLHLPIDINGASVEDLQALPGIGPALAARLAAGRPYRSIEDLSGVSGIGRKRFAALAPAVEVVAVAEGSR